MKQISDAELFSKLRDTIRTGTYVIPDRSGYRGTGGPGLLLEKILGFDPNKGNMHAIVRLCGWPDKNGRSGYEL